MAEGGGFFLPRQIHKKRRGTAGIRDADWTPGVHASLTRWSQAISIGTESHPESVDIISPPSPPPPPPSMKGKEPAVPQDHDNKNKKRKLISVKNSRPRVMGEQIASSSATKKKKPPPPPPSPLTAPWVLDRFRGMGAPEHLLTRVLSKRLTVSDISREQNRLQLSPVSVHQSGLLQVLEQGVEEQLDTEGGVAVVAVDCRGREYRLSFKHIPSNKSYRIMGSEYRRFVEANDLKDGEDTLHLCLFYVAAADGFGKHLRVGIVKVRD